MNNLVMKAQKFADENRNKFFCVMEKGSRRIVCDEEETLIRGQKQWIIIYGCRRNFTVGEGRLVTISPTAYDLIILHGWYEESKREQPLESGRRKKQKPMRFGGFECHGEWYHPKKPPKEFIERVQKAFEEVILKPMGYRFAPEQNY